MTLQEQQYMAQFKELVEWLQVEEAVVMADIEVQALTLGAQGLAEQGQGDPMTVGLFAFEYQKAMDHRDGK